MDAAERGEGAPRAAAIPAASARPGRFGGPLPRRLFALLRLVLAAALVAWALSRPGAREALAALLSRPLLLCALPLFGFLGASLEALRLASLVRAQEVSISWRAALRVVLVGSFVNHALSGAAAGDLARLVALVRHAPAARVEVGAALVVDRLIALGSLLLAVLACVWLERELVLASELARAASFGLVVGAASLAFALALSLSRRVHERLAPRAPRAQDARGLRAFLARLSRALLAYRGRERALVLALFLSLAGHALLFGLILVQAHFVLPEVQPRSALALTLLALVANALPVTPGGLGVGEAASEALFATAGLAGGTALVLGWRAAQLPVVLLGALLVARRASPPA